MLMLSLLMPLRSRFSSDIARNSGLHALAAGIRGLTTPSCKPAALTGSRCTLHGFRHTRDTNVTMRCPRNPEWQRKTGDAELQGLAEEPRREWGSGLCGVDIRLNLASVSVIHTGAIRVQLFLANDIMCTDKTTCSCYSEMISRY